MLAFIELDGEKSSNGRDFDSKILINPDEIQIMEQKGKGNTAFRSTFRTRIVITSGAEVLVSNSIEEILQKITDFETENFKPPNPS